MAAFAGMDTVALAGPDMAALAGMDTASQEAREFLESSC
jgi:hypothetical protein